MNELKLRYILEKAGADCSAFSEEKLETAARFIRTGVGYAGKGDFFFLRGRFETGQPADCEHNRYTAERAWHNGASYVFTTEQYKTKRGNDIPCIIVDDPNRLYMELSSELRAGLREGLSVTAVTGTVGKTTTKDMMVCVASRRFKVHYGRGNTNGFDSIGRLMQSVPEDADIYIQEVGAFYPGLIREGAAMLRPEVCLVTNIGLTHIDLYGSKEAIMEDKLQLVRQMGAEGVAFLNYDDPMLRAADISHKTVWFSAGDSAADFYAANVRSEKGRLDFDVCGKCETTHVSIESFGQHNVINAVAAFAYGMWLGIPEEEIAAGLGEYKTEGMRQNLCCVGGYKIYMDCYNASPETVEGAVETLLRIPAAEGGKHIAVLGDIERLGVLAAEEHRMLGERMGRLETELYLCFGPNMGLTAEELRKQGRNVLHTNDRNQLDLWLTRYAQPGDVLLFKGGHNSFMAKTVDNVFGTAFHISEADLVSSSAVYCREKGLRCRAVDGMIDIRKCLSDEEEIQVPAEIMGLPVVRIGEDAFSRRRKLKKLLLPEGLRNIGMGAFYICPALEELSLPSSLNVIERSAFNYCRALRRVRLPDGLLSLGVRAFYDCVRLERVYMGPELRTIGKEAFENCGKLTIYGCAGSYAEEYAREMNFAFSTDIDEFYSPFPTEEGE